MDDDGTIDICYECCSSCSLLFGRQEFTDEPSKKVIITVETSPKLNKPILTRNEQPSFFDVHISNFQKKLLKK
jgi:hypothetical protein